MFKKINCKYISIWDDGRTIETEAILDTDNFEMDITMTEENIEDCDFLIGEQIIINDKIFEIELNGSTIDDDYIEQISLFLKLT